MILHDSPHPYHHFSYDPVFDVELDIIAETAAERTCTYIWIMMIFSPEIDDDQREHNGYPAAHSSYYKDRPKSSIRSHAVARGRSVGYDLDWDTFEIGSSGRMGL